MLVAVLAVALLLRSAFCGWICPLGFLQDLVSNFSSVLQKRIPGLRRGIASLKKRGARLAVLDRYLRYMKYLVLAWAVGGSAYFGYMVFRDYDPWSALLNVAEFSFTPGVDRPGRDPGCLVLHRAALVPLCLPAGRRQRHPRQSQPDLPEARRKRLHFLQNLHQSLPDGDRSAYRHDHQKRRLQHLPGMCGSLPAQRRAGSQIRFAHHREIRRTDMRINPILYGVFVLTVFFGIILGFQVGGYLVDLRQSGRQRRGDRSPRRRMSIRSKAG